MAARELNYVLLWEKGYQVEDVIQSDVTIKLSGVTHTNFSAHQFQTQIPSEYHALYNRIWYATDVVPSQFNDAFFVMTNLIITPNQTLSTCDESVAVEEALCNESSVSCNQGESIPNGNGISTGRCIASRQNSSVRVCEVAAWCPVESNISPLTNIVQNANTKHLKTCVNNNKDKFCPVFRLGDIVDRAGLDFSKIALSGAVVAINIRWICDLDLNFEENCLPEYSFQTLPESNSKIAPGWNFRKVYYFFGQNIRTTYQAFGIKFVTNVQGKARKFSFIPVFQVIGAGLGLTKFVPYVCEFLLSRMSQDYEDKKFETIDQNDKILSTKEILMLITNLLCKCNKCNSGKRSVRGHSSPEEILNADLYNRIWDSTDVVGPPEAEAFFVMTNVVITPNQTLRTCGETPNIMKARCTRDSDCEKGLIFRRGSGVLTGKCILSDQEPDSDPILDSPSGSNKTIKVCEVAGWCPLELNITSPLKDNKALLASAENYKVTIKNTISFPSFGDQYTRTNMQRNVTEIYLHNCTFNETTDLFCPVFRIGHLVRGAGLNFSTVALKGAIISIVIRWYCNLDLDIDTYCIPKYSFQSLSDDSGEVASKAPGWNFKHATYHEFNRRTLFKAYGIKFIIDVQGQGRQFQFYPMFVAIGSGLGFMKFIPLFSNGLLNCLSNNFRKMQNELVASDEDKYKSNILRLCCCCRKEERSDGDEDVLLNNSAIQNGDAAKEGNLYGYGATVA
ncbi:hypothetical protein B566_EDAN006353 [Ephemera danica]|nr:hypothetical protein B566_EDAN006353 [Ephemera danica]